MPEKITIHSSKYSCFLYYYFPIFALNIKFIMKLLTKLWQFTDDVHHHDTHYIVWLNYLLCYHHHLYVDGCDAIQASFEGRQDEAYLWTIHTWYTGNGLASKR